MRVTENKVNFKFSSFRKSNVKNKKQMSREHGSWTKIRRAENMSLGLSKTLLAPNRFVLIEYIRNRLLLSRVIWERIRGRGL